MDVSEVHAEKQLCDNVDTELGMVIDVRAVREKHPCPKLVTEEGIFIDVRE